MPSHYLNQCLNICNWTHKNKLQWDFYRNSYILIQENSFKYMLSGKWRPFCFGLNVFRCWYASKGFPFEKLDLPRTSSYLFNYISYTKNISLMMNLDPHISYSHSTAESPVVLLITPNPEILQWRHCRLSWDYWGRDQTCWKQEVTLTHLPWTKWLPFRRWYFQMHLCEWKVLYFDKKNFTEDCS